MISKIDFAGLYAALAALPPSLAIWLVLGVSAAVALVVGLLCLISKDRTAEREQMRQTACRAGLSL